MKSEGAKGLVMSSTAGEKRRREKEKRFDDVFFFKVPRQDIIGRSSDAPPFHSTANFILASLVGLFATTPTEKKKDKRTTVYGYKRSTLTALLSFQFPVL